MDLSDAKADLRKRQLAWRRDLPAATLTTRVDAAIAHLLAHPAWARARTVALYAALPGEPVLDALARDAWSRGARVALPVVPGRDVPLAWRSHHPDVPLVPGRFRVPVPPRDAAPIPAGQVDLVLVPALAVDPDGYRLGYGGGYYDRSLPGMPDALRVWVGLPEQRLPSVPHDDLDQPVHVIVTSRGWFGLDAARQA